MAPPPSSQDWEEKRGLICQLYLYDGWTLSKVREHMRKAHGFDATKRMYNGKFNKWSVRKNQKRKAAGLDEVVVGQDTFEASTLSDIDFDVPPSLPTPDPPQYIQNPNGLTHSNMSLRLYQPPTTPHRYRIPEEIFNHTERYLRTFHGDTRQSPSSLERGLKSQNAVMDLFDSACWLLSFEERDEAFNFLNKFGAALIRMTKFHPSLISLPYQVLDECSSIPDHNIASSILRNIYDIFAVQLKGEHPISIICQHLMRFQHRDELLQPAMEQICKILLDVYGPTNSHTLDVQEVHNWILLSNGHFSDAETQARRLLIDCGPSLGVDHKAVLRFRNQLACALLKQEKFAQAAEVACFNLEKAGFSCNQPEGKDEVLFSLIYFHVALVGQGKFELAESVLKGALRLSIDLHKAHYITRVAFKYLLRFLLNQDREDEADWVSGMSLSKLRKSYLDDRNNWDEKGEKNWASEEGEEAFKCYPYPHTMYCGCHLWAADKLLHSKDTNVLC